jgi:hypothetical protein
MASKYQRITDLYESTIKDVTQSPKAWTAFLRSACLNYKLRFDEQILVYAQRPDATAVLEIERWNDVFKRWVNRGATGIAVFDDGHDGQSRLKHYFDISDTHESRFALPVPVWHMRPEYEAETIEHLENSFGDLADKSTLADTLVSAAKNAVDDNLADYLRELTDCREDSLLEELDGFNVEVEYKTLLQNSVAYMMMTRCGIDIDEYFDFDDFKFIIDFNTRQTVNALGIAASDIAETCLREIAPTALNLQRLEQNQNRTFANRGQQRHTVPNRQIEPAGQTAPAAENERSVEDGTDISDGGRLPHTEPDRAGGSARSPWQIRVTQEEVPQREPQGAVREPADGGDAERTSGGDRADGQRAVGTDHQTDSGAGGRDGSAESPRPNEVGGADEQHPPQRGGNDTERPDIRVKPLPTVAKQLNLFGEAEETAKAESPAFSVSGQIIDEVLTSGGNEPDSVLRIVSYFKKDHMTAANAEFLRNEYLGVPARAGGKGFIFGGNRVSVRFDERGIRVAAGDTALTDTATPVTWESAARRIRELLDLGRYAPQSELNKADGNELLSLANHIWELRRDRADGIEFDFIDPDMFGHGHPDDIARIAEILANPAERAKILAGLEEFSAAYQRDSGLLRFP